MTKDHVVGGPWKHSILDTSRVILEYADRLAASHGALIEAIDSCRCCRIDGDHKLTTWSLHGAGTSADMNQFE